VRVRKARVGDAGIIRKISVRLTVSRTSKSVGFVEYETPGLDELRSRIELSDFFYVAEENGKVIGFLSAYSKTSLERLKFNNDKIVEFILKKKEKFIYWDQLGIEEEFQKKGFGRKLIERFVRDVEYSKYGVIFGAVCYKPRKKISIGLLEKLGWKLFEKIKIYNGLVFGIYGKEAK
jgi:GNAT superfamily N-acetyltransferase